LVRVFGGLAERTGLPASVGEIIAGISLAFLAIQFSQKIPFLSQVTSSEALSIVAELGIFFLVLVAGIEMEPKEIQESSTASFVVAVGGMALPLAGGFSLAWYFLPASELKLIQALITGVALSISAIPATVKILNDLDLLHTKMGRTIVSAAIFDDVFGLFLLAIVLALIESGNAPTLMSLLWLMGKIALFFVITINLGAHVYPRIHKGIRALNVTAIDFSALAGVALAYGWLAEVLGMHWIMGAFMAGIYFEPSRVGKIAYEELKLICSAITAGFLGPFFFGYIGLRVDLSAISEAPVFLLLLILIAIGGKTIGAGLPARAFGFTNRESLSVGVGMSARGAVELAILSIAYEAGVFAQTAQHTSVASHCPSSYKLEHVSA
jgi:Kef-type K+ transport system membrane component KefB